MAKQEVITQKITMTKKRLMIIGALTAAVAAFVLFSDYGLLQRVHLRSEQNDLNAKIGQLKLVEDSLKAAIVMLQSDTLEIERLARERYGLVRSDEEIYIIKHETLE